MQKTIMNGNQAAAHGVKLCRPQVISAFPITPQTSVVETIANFWAEGKLEGEFTVVDSEYSAMSYLIGASYSGARTFTATSSHGLAYMHEVLHWAAGSRLPIVMVNANRAMGAPWCLEPDQGDSLAQRDTGWMQIYCSSVQEILHTVIIAFRLAEKTRIPCMVVYDGFTLSHTYEPVDIPEQDKVDAFLPPPPEKPRLQPGEPVHHLPLADSFRMSALKRDHFRVMQQFPAMLSGMREEMEKTFGRSYSPLEGKEMEEAKTAVISSGAVSQTVESSLTYLNQEGEEKVGLIRIRLFRPFPARDLVSLLSSGVEKIVVVDRNLTGGSRGIFYREIRSYLHEAGYQGKVYELNLGGGIDITQELLSKCLEKIRQELSEEEIIWGVELYGG